MQTKQFQIKRTINIGHIKQYLSNRLFWLLEIIYKNLIKLDICSQNMLTHEDDIDRLTDILENIPQPRIRIHNQENINILFLQSSLQLLSTRRDMN